MIELSANSLLNAQTAQPAMKKSSRDHVGTQTDLPHWVSPEWILFIIGLRYMIVQYPIESVDQSFPKLHFGILATVVDYFSLIVVRVALYMTCLDHRPLTLPA